MDPTRIYDNRFDRLFMILKRLADHGIVSTRQLHEELGVSLRAIQEDIRLLKRHLPVVNGPTRGTYRLAGGASLIGSGLNHEEVVVLLLSLKPLETGRHLREIANAIVRKSLRKEPDETPMIIKSEGMEDLDLEAPKNRRLLEAIEHHRIIFALDEKGKEREIEPYKIISFEGIWYLFGRDMARGKLDLWPLAELRSIHHSHEKFQPDVKAIEKTIEERVHSPWFEEGSWYDVVVRVSPAIADHFRLRPLLTTQKILQESPDGSLTIRFRVTHDEDIDNIVKAWLPDIEVLEPLRYRRKLLGELRNYLQTMESDASA